MDFAGNNQEHAWICGERSQEIGPGPSDVHRSDPFREHTSSMGTEVRRLERITRSGNTRSGSHAATGGDRRPRVQVA
jgi:hypothetical protein